MSKETTIWIVIAVYVLFMLAVGILNSKNSKGMAAFGGAMVSATEVRISPDLSVAKVYVSIFPSAKAEAAMQTINENSRAIRGELGHIVAKQFRIVPELVFYLDSSLDYAEHIDELLKK